MMVAECTSSRLLACRALAAFAVLFACLTAIPVLALADVGLYGELSEDGKTLTYKYGEGDVVWDNNRYVGNYGCYLTQSAASRVETIVFDESTTAFKPRTIAGLFCYAVSDEGDLVSGGYTGLRTIEGISRIDTSSTEGMYSVFEGCKSLASLDLSGWDTSNATNMDDMFKGCANLTTLKLGDKFIFANSGAGLRDTARWQSSSDGNYYQSSEIPSSVAATYSSTVGLYGTKDPSDQAVIYSYGDIPPEGYSQTLNYGGTNVYTNSFVTDSIQEVSFDATCSDWRPRNLYNFFNSFFSGGYSALTAVNGLGNIDTAACEDMSSAFSVYEYPKVQSIDLAGFDTSACKSMESMFAGSHMTSLNLTSFNTSSCTNLEYMFSSCGSLESVNMDGWDVSSCTSFYSMFLWCPNLSTVSMEGWSPSHCLNANNMFSGCTSLTSLDLSGWDLSSCTSIDQMFYECASLSSLNLEGWKVSELTSAYGLFDGCESLSELDLSGWNVAGCTNMSMMFNGCSSLVSLNLSGWNPLSCKDASEMFSGCSALESLNLSGWKLSQCVDFNYMFAGCTSLSELSLSGWSTSAAESMESMFDSCSSLTALDLASFSTAKVENMRAMFSGCSSLESLDVSKLSTASCEDMSSMFRLCTSLQSIDLSGHETSECRNMSLLFEDCWSLTSAKLGSLDTSKVEGMHSMFENCSSLTNLDLSSFDTSVILPDEGYYWRVRGMTGMFAGCSSLATLKLGPKFSFSGGAEDRFNVGLRSDISWLSSSDGKLYPCDGIPSNIAATYGARVVVTFDPNGGTVNPETKVLMPGQEIGEMPVPEREGYTFVGWDGALSSSRPDQNQTLKALWQDSLLYGTLSEDGSTMTLRYGAHEAVPEIQNKHDIKRVVLDDSIALFKPVSLAYLFDGYTSLEKIDNLSLLDTSLCEDMRCMFQNCFRLRNIDLSGFDTSSCGEMRDMFIECGLTKLTLGPKFSFNGCQDERQSVGLPVGDWVSSVDGSVFSSEMLPNNTAATYSLLSDDEPGTGLYGLVSEDGTTLTYCYGEHGRQVVWNEQEITKVVFDDSIKTCKPERLSFAWYGKLSSIEHLDYLDTSAMTDMSFMFAGCSSLTQLDLSTFDVSNVTKTNCMFEMCDSLEELNLANWNTSAVIDMHWMFRGCPSLTSLDLSSFETPAATDMGYMFAECSALQEVDLTGFDTSSCWTMKSVFAGCDALATLKVGDKFSFNGSADYRQDTGLRADVGWSSGPTALYTADSIPNNVAATYQATVTAKFDGCGGLVVLPGASSATGEATAVVSVPAGEAIVELPGATLADHEFLGWFVEDEQIVAPYTPVTNNIVIQARWKATVQPPPTPAPTPAPAPDPAPTPAVAKVTMHRLYNPNSGEHFYTASTGEKNVLASIGWNYEGTGWIAPKTSSKPVYRLYNENAGDHHYTTSANEKNTLVSVGWRYEGIGWYSAESNGQPLYRQYNPNAQAGSHNYTTSKNENDSLVRLGWRAEGIGWYGVK